MEVFYLTDVDFNHLVNRYLPEMANYHYQYDSDTSPNDIKMYNGIWTSPGTEAEDLKKDIVQGFFNDELNLAHEILEYLYTANHIDEGTYIVEVL